MIDDSFDISVEFTFIVLSVDMTYWMRMITLTTMMRFAIQTKKNLAIFNSLALQPLSHCTGYISSGASPPGGYSDNPQAWKSV